MNNLIQAISQSLDDLAAQQGVSPVSDLETISALWPLDDDPDALLKHIQRERDARRSPRRMGSDDDGTGGSCTSRQAPALYRASRMRDARIRAPRACHNSGIGCISLTAILFHGNVAPEIYSPALASEFNRHPVRRILYFQHYLDPWLRRFGFKKRFWP
jgi:hypothetical protein